MFLPQGFLTLFAMWLPMETAVECLGLVEVHGVCGMVAIALAVLESVAERLLRLQSMEQLLVALQDLKSVAPQPARLVPAAHVVLGTVAAAETPSPRGRNMPWKENWTE